MDNPQELENETETSHGLTVYPLPPSVRVHRDTRVQMRDGEQLAITIYRPPTEEPVPAILSVTAYGKDFGPDQYVSPPPRPDRSSGAFRISDVTARGAPDPAFWTMNGYAVIIADARGYFASSGAPGIVSRQDAEDYAELIEWAAVQSWCNGAVGLAGASYLAMSQWNCASRTHPTHLKAIIPWEAPNDLGRDTLAHGGVPETWFRKIWGQGALARGGGPEMAVRAPELLDAAMDDPMPVDAIDVPALVCASWSCQGLHSRGSFEAYTRIASPRKWLFTHGQPFYQAFYSPEALAWQKAFFDAFLKGQPEELEARPRVRLETRITRDRYEVRDEAMWPIASCSTVALYLDVKERRLSTKPVTAAGENSYDSATGETLDLDFPVDRDLEVTGHMSLRAWVSAGSAQDLDLFVAVRKLAPDGSEVNFYATGGDRRGVVALGWLRVSQRHKDLARSQELRPFLTHDRQELLIPGEVVPVDIELLPSSTLFEAGSTLRLSLRGRDILDNAEIRHDRRVNIGVHALHSGPERPSCLWVPIREREVN